MDFMGACTKRLGPCKDPTAYSMAECYPELTTDQIQEFILDPATYLEAEPIPNALWGLDQLRKVGYDLVFCTVRPIENKHTAKWLEFYNIEVAELNRFENMDDKIEHIAQRNPDIAIDDNQAIVEVLNVNHHVNAMLLAQAWNHESPGIIRAADWPDAINLITGSAYEV